VIKMAPVDPLTIFVRPFGPKLDFKSIKDDIPHVFYTTHRKLSTENLLRYPYTQQPLVGTDKGEAASAPSHPSPHKTLLDNNGSHYATVHSPSFPFIFLLSTFAHSFLFLRTNRAIKKKAPGSDAKFFTTNRKGENHELREELRSPDRNRKRDAVKKVSRTHFSLQELRVVRSLQI
jgi:hypothetical protein